MPSGITRRSARRWIWMLPKAPCDSTFLYLFERVELEQLFGLLRDWMLAQIADQDKDFDQLICDGKTLRGSAGSA